MTVTLSLEIKYVYFFLKHKLLLPRKLQKKHIYITPRSYYGLIAYVTSRFN
jgi:hypothetical protein